MTLSKKIVGVDLASRFSAVVVRDSGGEVISQFDSSELTTLEFVNHIVEVSHNALLIVEDVPFGISSQSQVKPVLRLQGILIGALASQGGAEPYFVSPSSWMNYFGGFRVNRKFTQKAERERRRLLSMRDKAFDLGYSPPSLAANYYDECREAGLKPYSAQRDVFLKIETDYVAAFLITEWGRSLTSRDTPQLQPAFI